MRNITQANAERWINPHHCLAIYLDCVVIYSVMQIGGTHKARDQQGVTI